MPKGYVPAIFISSTCYDLGQLRANLADFVKSIGLDPIMSEYAIFPVDPDYDAISNCMETVKTRADIFVLVVGARYGQIPRNGKSVTNMEYLEAKAKGIPVYIFVNKPVLNIFEVWRKNPTADYNNIVDSTSLFEFVDSLRTNAEHWIFGFETAQDIIDTLRIQLAYLFMDSLVSRSRIRSVGLPHELQSLEPRALEILLQKPVGWEYLLFSEVFRDCISALKYRRYDYDYGVNTKASIAMRDTVQLMDWMSAHMVELSQIAEAHEKLINEALPIALGPPGTPGDPSRLVYIARRMGKLYERTIDWALEFQCIYTDKNYSKLMQICSRMTKNIISRIEEFAEQTHYQLNTELSKGTSERKPIHLKLGLELPDLTEFHEEMESLLKKLTKND